HPIGVRGGCSPQNKRCTSNTYANPSLPRKHWRVSAWLCRIFLHFCIGSTHFPVADAHPDDRKAVRWASAAGSRCQSHRKHGSRRCYEKRFIVRANEMLTTFRELERRFV